MRPERQMAGRVFRDHHRMRRVMWRMVFSIVIVLVGGGLVASAQAQQQLVEKQIEPFRVIGNIYYVGFGGETAVGSFLMTTPEGHILLDTGYPQTTSWLKENIEKLDFKLTDIKIILTAHAHVDHVGGHALFKELTGAKVLAAEADFPVIADGGRSDFRSDGRELWKPITPDGVIRDGQEVRLGGTTLVAHLTPGHTKGCTTWTMVVEDGGQKYNVVFHCGSRINPNVPLIGNAKYPNIAEDFAKSFRVFRSLPCDVFLAMHAHFYNFEEKARLLKQGVKPNPFIDPKGYREYVEKYEKAYLDQLAKERGVR